MKSHLSRHYAMQHSMLNEAKKLKVKTPFYMISSDYTQVTRYVCQSSVRWIHFARNPTDPINHADIKAECKWYLFIYDKCDTQGLVRPTLSFCRN